MQHNLRQFEDSHTLKEANLNGKKTSCFSRKIVALITPTV